MNCRHNESANFLAAFTRRKKLSEKEIEEIQQLIDAYKREG